MQKDFKTGTLVGLILVAGAIIWFSTREQNPIKPSQKTIVPKADNIRYQTKLPSYSYQRQSNGTANTETAPEPPQPKILRSSKHKEKERPTTHIVKKGESLSTIAEKYYGSSKYWEKIFEANNSVLRNPHQLKPGTKLTIPR